MRISDWISDVCSSDLVCDLLGLDDAVAESLALQPSRGTPAEVMADPTIYRLTEAVSVYGPALKALIHEEFGDGIMSAINFTVDINRRPAIGRASGRERVCQYV